MNQLQLVTWLRDAGDSMWIIAVLIGSVLTAWLIGLAIVMRGSEPKDRPDILRAYATCQPLRGRINQRKSDKAGPDQLDEPDQ